MATTRKLTPRQRRFVEEYLVDLNATQAAIRAGYSAKTAEQQGPRVLGYVGVRQAIEAAQAKRSERTNITVDWVLHEIREIASTDEQSNNRLRALELLGKHLGMFPTHITINDRRRRLAAVLGVAIEELPDALVED